jgi:hypothetical protein
MKIREEHYQQLKSLIEERLDQLKATRSEVKEFYESDPTLSDKRFRWDLLWAINKEQRTPLFDEFYQYMDDTHIDTALKNIVQEIDWEKPKISFGMTM